MNHAGIGLYLRVAFINHLKFQNGLKTREFILRITVHTIEKIISPMVELVASVPLADKVVEHCNQLKDYMVQLVVVAMVVVELKLRGKVELNEKTIQ